MCCGKHSLIVFVLNWNKVLSYICILVGIVLTISLSICNAEILNTCSLIFCSRLNLNVSFVEAEGYSLKNLIHDRGAVLNSYISGAGFIDYKLSCILGRYILCKIGVVQSDVVDCINVKQRTHRVENPDIAFLYPVSRILSILCITLGRNIYICSGNVFCSYIKNYFLSLEVMLGYLDPSGSLIIVIIIVPRSIVIIGNIEYRSYIINVDLLRICNHLIGGNVCKGHLYDIITVAGQRNNSLILIRTRNFCPSNRGFLFINFNNRSI